MKKDKVNILIVEDEEGVRTALGEIFDDPDTYHLFFAVNGNQALRLLIKERINIVLLDLQLPDMHGVEILQKIKGDILTKDIEVIILTGEDSSELIEKCLNEGAYSYIIKASETMLQIESIVLEAIKSHNLKKTKGFKKDSLD